MRLEELISRQGRRLELAEGDHLFRQGDRDPRVFSVCAGNLKAYYLRADGREHVKSLFGPGGIVGSIAVIDEGGLCTFSLVALSRVSLVALPLKTLVATARLDLELAGDVIDFLVGFARKKERREYELLCLTAEDRYARFLNDSSVDHAGISQADIAAYVGVTPQALSRIKRRRKVVDEN